MFGTTGTIKTLVCFVILFTVFFSASISAQTKTPNISFTVLTLPATSIPYVSLVDLAEKYNIQMTYDPVTLSMTLKRRSASLHIIHQSPIALLNNQPVNMLCPARLIQGTIFVPVPTFLPLFSELIPGTLVWDEKKKKITASGPVYTIDSVKFEIREGGTLIKIALAEPLKVSNELTSTGWLNIRLAEGSFDPSLAFPDTSAGLIQETRHFQHEGEAVLSFKVSENMDTYSISRSSDPEELFISLWYKRPRISVTANDTSSVPVSIEPPVNKDLWTIDTVVIDPGHGGQDSGAIGPRGIKEKNIVLAVAKELKKIIDESSEIRVALTREKDVFVSLRERSNIANRSNGKLFISIHVNASPAHDASGMEIYFLSEAKTEGAKHVAERENASAKFEDNPGYYSENADIFSKILMGMASNVYIKESQDICNLILDRCVQATKQENRGVKQADFWVMLGTQGSMPSIFIELGFISNPAEEKMLARVSYQKRVAQAIYDAIIEFKRRAERDFISRGD